ncbi:SAM-dependent methyltransferase [Halomonas denitrificans]|nr:cyclopropane-fatty-acyl-phospholipid synthase family protein [Halomonas denitrificans]
MSAIDWAERGWVPDTLIRQAIRRLLRQRLREEFVDDVERQGEVFERRIGELRESEIALETEAANEQHYEVPAGFYELALGRHLKYSSAYFPDGVRSLDEAEAAMLALTCERAGLQDGQAVLELGCGWGSLTLWMAEQYPGSSIVGVSNSASQRRHILARAADRGLDNIEILTCDVNRLELDRTFDRVVSVEMFEHVRNYRRLLERIAGWLTDDGQLFVHVFCHRFLMYPFETQGDDNWMGQHFFTGGLMPSADTFFRFQDHLRVTRRWLVDGRHYARTSRAWLDNLDRNRDAALALFENDGSDVPARIRVQRWRMFFMACEELFAYNGGSEWPVAHYRFERR